MPKAPGDSRQLSWLNIDNFAAGIVTNSDYAGSLGAVPVKAPQGIAAQRGAGSAGTWGCRSLPNGQGLTAMPGQILTIGYPGLESNTNGTWVVGAIVLGPVNVPTHPGYPNYDFGYDDILAGFDTIDNSGNKTFEFTVQLIGTGVLPTVIETIGPNACNTNLGITYMSFAMTQLDSFLGTPIDIQSVCAISYAQLNNSGETDFAGVFPHPTNASDAYYLIASPTAVPYPRIVFTHQNRIIWLVQSNCLWWPSLGTGRLIDSEQFAYTDPPGDVILTDTLNGTGSYESFVNEYPWAHGAWGSVSAGELFLVRHKGGAYIIQGDLNNPSVTRLWGVMSTFGTVQRACEHPLGLIYCSQNNGAWVWAGGSSSVKISQQLNDNFFQPPTPTAPSALGGGALPTSGPQFNIERLGSLVFFPNNWVYDVDTQSWWMLDNPSTLPPCIWFGASWDGSSIYVFPQYIPYQPSGPNNYAYQYSIKEPTSQWQWLSQPIRLDSMDPERGVQVREVIIRAQGSGTVQITVTGAGGTASITDPIAAFSVTDIYQPQVQRFLIGTPTSGGPLQADHILVTILSTGESGGPAPTVYSVTVGYQQPQALTSMT